MKKQILSLVVLSTAFLSGCANICGCGHNCKATSNVVIPANFAFDSAVLPEQGKKALTKTIKQLKNNPAEKVMISGYTDNVGDEAYNIYLSEKRAESVEKYLEEKGIKSSRISTKGFGEANPVASNKTAEGRYKNRRTVVKTYK